MNSEDFFDIDTTLLSIKPNPATRYLQFFLSEHPLASQNGMVPVSARGRFLRKRQFLLHWTRTNT